MGRGDLRTKKGKRVRSSYGNSRPKGPKSAAGKDSDKKKK